ncbi:glutathione S-transferase theta-1 [Aplysia californica]|uniref:Glutathione S-transferase theta-1 n=1 Tax=Aplysia californica TaxID=6500 RepID=A0ABM0JAR3_APLCA|nr:glutathione S-transferase theta-1 [Aplysia californica]
MPLKYYYDLLSQPSRAVYLFLTYNKVPFEAKPVALRKNEHYSAEFKKINPFSLVPAIDDDGFCLTESTAIAKYVIQKFNLPDHWFPQKDIKKQARVEEYLHWHHFNTRALCANLFRNLLILPRATGKKADPEDIEKQRQRILKIVIPAFENYFLKDRPYLAGNEISLADLFGSAELLQLKACNEEYLYEQSPIVKAWLERVRKETNPYFDESNKLIYRTGENFQNIISKL